jgi:hypothetical protein
MAKAQESKAEAVQDEQFIRSFGTEHRGVATNRRAPRSPLRTRKTSQRLIRLPWLTTTEQEETKVKL